MQNTSTDTKAIRIFGVTLFAFFGILAAVGFWLGKGIGVVFFTFLSTMGLIFFILPKPMTPVYALWMKVSHVIGVMITAFVLSLAYYLVMTPAALLKCLFGGRPLQMNADPDQDSYWISRTHGGQQKEQYEKRY